MPARLTNKNVYILCDTQNVTFSNVQNKIETENVLLPYRNNYC